MNSAYGAANFDSSRGCWRHSFQAGGDSMDYCMVAATPYVINSGDGARIYLQTHSDPQAGIYSQVDPGLEGLFFIGLGANQKWTALASSPAIDMGQAGDCGCSDSKVIDVGPNIHGWLSTVGGVWQGVQVTRYSLQVPMGGKIRDVSEIPRVSENSPDESNALEVDRDGKVVAGMYPIKVTQTRAGNVLGTRLVSYDERKGVYPWDP
ncbi:hypothetical protein KHF85_12110 [Xanthomonas translucens pv. graminis]|nr:hypothetical protein KHF85_12110 [Xanthomonas translucens pv. graminis]